MPISIHAKRGIFLAVILLLLIGTVLSLGLAHYLIRPTRTGGEDTLFMVREGATLREVAEELERSGIISSKTLLLLWNKVTGQGARIKAGEYRLNADMPPLKVLDTLTRGIVITHSVTIPEGFTVRQIAEALDRRGLTDGNRFLTLATDPDIPGRYGLSAPTLEGYLYPDTYRFSRGRTPMFIMDVMVRRFFDMISPLHPRMEASGMTLNQIVTLASVIEKETGKGEERPVIASVFLNRLKKGMRLESDPTVIYGIGGFNGNLTRQDLRQFTPYNTYVIRGLPPGPIACPGTEAIEAVLFPAKTDFLYFVSRNDGTHHFSKTLTEHNRAVTLYQKKGRKEGREIS